MYKGSFDSAKALLKMTTKRMILKKIKNLLLLTFLFFLPWQTRYIWQEGQLNGGHWEYGALSIYGTEILVWIIILLFFLRYLLGKNIKQDFLTRSRVLGIIFPVIFLVLTAFSLGFSENFWVSYQYVFRWLGAMAFFVVLGKVNNSQQSKHLLALWLGAVVQGLLAVYQFLTQHVFASKWLGMSAQDAMQGGASVVEFADQRWLRAYGSFGSPNSLGIYLAVLLVLGFILYLKTERPLYKILISVGQLIMVSGLLFSFSRGAWLSAVVGIVVLAFVIFIKQKEWRLFFVKQTIFILVLAGFWLGIFFPIFRARFNIHNRLEVYSIAERQSQYKESQSFIKSRPFFGVGPALYTFAVSKKYPKLASWQFQPVHNIYVLATVEFGILFSLFLGLMILTLIKRVYQHNLIFLPVLLALLVAGLFDHWLFSMFTGLVFWWVMWSFG
jgi:O-antigen ligase